MRFVWRGLLVLSGLWGVVVLGLACLIGPYLLAGSQYERVMKRQPTTRRELEASFWYTGHRPIAKAESDWGRYTAVEGAYERYTVLGAPIDVVYAGDRVVRVFESYE